MKGEDEDMLGCVEMVWEEALNKGWKEGMNKGIKEGIKEGRKEGIKEGMNKGRKEGRKIIISSMLKRGMSLEEIREITKATKKEIEEAKE